MNERGAGGNEQGPHTNLQVLYCGEFKDGHPPLSFEVDERGIFEPLARIVRRARACLSNRDDLQIEFIAEFSDLLASAAIVGQRITGVFPDGRKQIVDASLASQLDEADLIKTASDALRQIIETADDGQFNVNLTDESGMSACSVPAMTPRDVLASCALVQCLRAQQFDSESWFASFGIEHAIAAAECVALAESQVDSVNSSTAQFKVQLSKANRSAANARWQKLEPVRERATKLYLGRRWSSRAEAARKIAPEITEIAKQAGVHLSPQNAVNTIDRWLKGIPRK